MSKLVIVSQLPPPVHGSSVITKLFLEILERLSVANVFIDRRFSLRIQEVGHFRWRKLLKLIQLFSKTVCAFAKREKPKTLIVFTSATRNAFIIDACICLIALAFRGQVVLYLHTNGFKQLARRYFPFGWLVRLVFDKSTMVVALSPSLARELPIGPKSKTLVRVINNSVSEKNAVSMDSRHLGNRNSVLFMSNLMPEKGVLDFIDFANLLFLQGKRYDFVIAGASADSHHLAQIQGKILESPCGDRIKLLGSIHGFEKDVLIENALFLVFPSTYKLEAQPLSIIEAMRLGTPTIAYDVGGLSELINPGGGLVANEKTPEALVDCFNLVADVDYLELREKVKQHYSEKFSNEVFSSSWKSALQDLEVI